MDSFGHVKDRLNFRQYAERHLIVKQKKALCIFHPDKNPSMHIYEDSFHCFTCHATGDIFDLHMKLFNVSKQEALAELAREAGVTLEPLTPEHKSKQDRRARLYTMMDFAARLYMGCLSTVLGDRECEYLKVTRGLSGDTVTLAMLGYAPNYAPRWLIDRLNRHGYSAQEIFDSGMAIKSDDGRLTDRFRNRIMIPMRDHKGRVVAFTGRAMGKDQTPKYLHNATSEIFDKGRLIYTPMPRVKNGQGEAQHTIVVVEGHMDAISALNRGFTNVYAQMGTSLTDDQMILLCQPGTERLIFCLDNDTAGREALRRLVQKHMHTAADKGVDLYAMTAPHGKDPDDTFREKPELWQPAVDAARPVVDVLLDLERPVTPTPAQKQAWALKMLPLLKGSNGFVNEDNMRKLSAALDSSLETIERWTRSQLSVMPKNPHAQKIDTSLPCLEEWVIHSLIVNDDAYWYERMNAALDTLTTESYPYALAPLSINDFQHKGAHLLMGCITRMVLDNDRPLCAALDAYFAGSNNRETYDRLRETENRSRILGGAGAMSYEEFLSAVFCLRRERLARDCADKRLDEATRRECAVGIALLNLAQEEL